MVKAIYPIAAAAGAGFDYLGNYTDEGRKAEAKREKDWLDFNQRKQQPGFNVDTDPYVVSHRKQMYAANPGLEEREKAADAQRLSNNQGNVGINPPGPRRDAQVAHLTSNPQLKAQFKNKYPYKYNELFNAPKSVKSPTQSGNTTTNAAQGAINNSQPSNQGSMVASNRNNPVDLGHLPNKPDGNIFTGSSPYVSTASLLNPVQQQAQSNLLPDITNRLRNPVGFDAISNDTIRKYNQEVLPKIAANHFNRTGGKASSPDYAQRLIGGGQDLQTKLAAQRAEFEQNARTQDQNLFGTLMGKSQESFYNPGEKGLAKEFASKALGKVSEFALDQGLDYIKSLWSTNPAEAVREGGKVIDALTPDKKKQLLEYVTTGAGKSSPQAVKDLVAKHATTSSGASGLFGSTAGEIAKTAAGATAAGVTLYYASKWLRPLIFDQGE